MAEKKYYWLKMTDQFFEDKAIKKLRKIAGGDTYTIIYLKMLLTAIKQGNKMYFEGIEDDFMEELALELDEDTDNVKVTVSYLKSKGLIEVLGADEILLTQCAEMVGSETDAARRKRLQRDRERNRAIGSDPVPALEEKSEVVVEEKPAKKKAENTIQLFHRLVEDYNISEPVREKMEVWFRYKMERKESYKEQGMKSLLKKTENNEGSYGANEICNLIEDCMANNWKGIIWKILEERKQQRPATRTEQIQQRVMRKVEGLDGEKVTVTLTNSQTYPFNNSVKTIQLKTPRNYKTYLITAEVISVSGGAVGDIEFTDKLLNGFKVAYTGSAKSVTMDLYVRGGM